MEGGFKKRETAQGQRTQLYTLNLATEEARQ